MRTRQTLGGLIAGGAFRPARTLAVVGVAVLASLGPATAASAGGVGPGHVVPRTTHALGTWSSQELAGSLDRGHGAWLNGVSCDSASFCGAGGMASNHAKTDEAVASLWNGHSWGPTVVAGSLDVEGAQVEGVSCPSPAFCAVGGWYEQKLGQQAFVATWNGHAWAAQEVAQALDTGDNAEINDLSCASPTFCVAGGDYETAAYTTEAFVATWNGHAWTSKELAGSLNVGFYGSVAAVSCATASLCVAGGQLSSLARTGLTAPFVSMWDGHDWSSQIIAASLEVGSFGSVDAVSCTTSVCAAGGSYVDGANDPQAFVSWWTGSTWSSQEVAAALDVGQSATVNGVSCAGTSFCVAVGSYQNVDDNNELFVSQWTGGTWSSQEAAASLNVGGGNDAGFFGVDCTSSAFCVAVGEYVAKNSSQQALASMWDGSAWTSEEVGGTLNVDGQADLSSVSCVGSSFCVAGGLYSDRDDHYQALESTWRR